MISVVVITRNNALGLKKCLDSLLNQNYLKKYEIIVIDNASRDQTLSVIKELQKKYKTLRYIYEKKKGRGFARNKGLKKAKGDIIAFTDDDCIVEKEWLNKFDKRFEEFPNVSAVGGAVYNGTDSKWGRATYLLNFSSWAPSRKLGYTSDIPTANISYKKYDLKQVNFPESDLNLDYEDTLFNLQLIKKGKKILFDPDIKVYHDFGSFDYTKFITKQQEKGRSFALRGYKAHGRLGLFLIRHPYILLLCPRIILIFTRCFKSKKLLTEFIKCFPLLVKGEYVRGLTVKNLK